jgi:hypothetical protein
MTETTRRPARKRPSPPWHGATTVALLWLVAAVLLSYTLLDLGWQQSLGGWNYWFAGALMVLISVLMRAWRADESGRSSTTRPAGRSPADREGGQG